MSTLLLNDILKTRINTAEVPVYQATENNDIYKIHFLIKGDGTGHSIKYTDELDRDADIARIDEAASVIKGI